MKRYTDNWKRVVFAGLVILAPGDFARAVQQTFDAAALALPMNNRMGSARSAVLGSGFTGIADDPAALLWNPAGLSQLTRGQVGLHHNSWIGDVIQETVLFALPVGKLGGIGVLANYVNYGTFDGRDEFGNPTRALGASDLGLGIGWGRKLVDNISAGFVFRRQQQTLADESYSTLSADVGALILLPYKFRLGFSYNNFGTQLAESQSATAIRAGAAWQTAVSKEMHLLFGAGYSIEPSSSDRIHLASEWKINSLVTARAGYEIHLGEDLIDDFSGATVGVGLSHEQIRVDYAFVPFGELGNAHRLSLVYSFDTAPRPVPTVQQSPAAPVAIPPALIIPQATPTPPPRLQFQVPQTALAQARRFEAEGKDREAIMAYNEAIHMNPLGIAGWRGLANIYYRLGRKDFALRCFDEVLKLNPQDQPLREWVDRYRLISPQ